MGSVRLDRMLVVDLEMTCWEEGVPPPGQRAEIVEIGVAEVLLRDGPPRLGRSASLLVRPPRGAEVTPYLAELTGITAAALRSRGRPLVEACGSLRKEFGGRGKAWSAWGRDDRDIADACARAGAEPPFSDEFTNLGTLYAMMTGAVRPVSLPDALAALGLAFEGTRHRAMDDALNAARAFVAMSLIILPRPSPSPPEPRC